MLSKAKIKWINSLKLKKNRDAENVFVAEGIKIVAELLPVLTCKFLVISKESGFTYNANLDCEIIQVAENEYKKITFQNSPQGVLAVFEKPKQEFSNNLFSEQLVLALENVQDPGNLGSIIRTADWFGIKHIFCSQHTADVFNPKVVQATMGAIARVQIHYLDLAALFADLSKDIPIYGTVMDGENIYQEKLNSTGIILMGNEGKGISKELETYLSKKLLIPTYPANTTSSESLNVAIATAITVAEFRRR